MDPISQEIIEALLSGKAPAGAIPEELAKVKSLIDRANAPASYTETTGAHHVIQAFRAAQGGAIPTGGRGKVLSKLLTAKAAAAAAAIALTGGAAAALTGVVPVSFHSNSHGALTSNAAQTNDKGTSTTDSTTSTTAAPNATVTTAFAGESQGMASGANLFGECTAYMAITRGSTTTTGVGSSTSLTGALASTNFQNLAKLAATQNLSVTSFCTTYLGAHKPGSQSANASANANANADTHANAGGTGNTAGSGNAKGGKSGTHGSVSAQGSVSVSGGATVGSEPPVTGVPASVPPVSVP